MRAARSELASSPQRAIDSAVIAASVSRTGVSEGMAAMCVLPCEGRDPARRSQCAARAASPRLDEPASVGSTSAPPTRKLRGLSGGLPEHVVGLVGDLDLRALGEALGRARREAAARVD